MKFNELITILTAACVLYLVAHSSSCHAAELSIVPEVGLVHMS
jgi:hypothetical protein